MVKRGNTINEGITYHNPITEEHERKKYYWICKTCGREYYFKSEAIDCEVSHKPKLKLPTIMEYRKKLDEEIEKKRKFIEENEELEEKEYQELKALRNKISSFEYSRKLEEHFRRWDI